MPRVGDGGGWGSWLCEGTTLYLLIGQSWRYFQFPTMKKCFKNYSVHSFFNQRFCTILMAVTPSHPNFHWKHNGSHPQKFCWQLVMYQFTPAIIWLIFFPVLLGERVWNSVSGFDTIASRFMFNPWPTMYKYLFKIYEHTKMHRIYKVLPVQTNLVYKNMKSNIQTI